MKKNEKRRSHDTFPLLTLVNAQNDTFGNSNNYSRVELIYLFYTSVILYHTA
jgi:hypothetical protein